jgi:catechol 2,3-dioxygenase-like lactoylglutathione lyase family enzyme
MHPHAPASLAIELDHIGLIVPDLGMARALFDVLGFTTTPRADHTRTDAQGRVVSAGSSQHSLMFQQGYVELMQITDRQAGHPLSAATDERHGLHVLAFGVADAAAWHARCQAQGMATGPVMDWSRPVSTPERSGLARFRFFDAPWHPRDPSYLCWVQHVTPELVRTPTVLRHANGACALAGIAYSGPAAALTAWAQRLRQAGVQNTARETVSAEGMSTGDRLALQPGWIDLCVDEAQSAVRPLSMTVTMNSPEILLAGARSSGLPTQQTGPNRWSVDLRRDAGLWLQVVRA